jgi:2,3-bisphosphoglycerate-dependent phosphoglycerate mutase
MDILFVRHGESEGNARGLMQGRLDLGLSERGRAQARRLAGWLSERNFGWSTAWTSPLARAAETAKLIAELTGQPPAVPEPDLAEIDAGSLEGLNRAQIIKRHPDFMKRPVTDLSDFAEFGGESYAEVQARAERLRGKLFRLHEGQLERVALVGHGGMNFQLLKLLICEPVPRVCIVRMGNCTATLVRVRERRGHLMGEVAWHVPVELMGGESAEGAGSLFR